MERRPWFKPKTFGYGWTPASWQGWALTLVALVVPFAGIVWLIAHHHPAWILPWVLVWVIALFVAIYFTAE